MSQNPVETWFGIGTHARVDALRVVWPSGTERSFYDIDANGLLVIEHPLP